jgi:hypothetical protein
VICRLHNLWSPFKIPFYLVPPIVFSFKAHAFFYLGTICRFSWNGTNVSHWRFHENRHMNTSADVSKFEIVPVHFKCWILLKPVIGGVDGSLHSTVHEQAQSNRACNIFNYVVFDYLRDSCFLYLPAR